MPRKAPLLPLGFCLACTGGAGADGGDAEPTGPFDAGLSPCGEPLTACPSGAACPPNAQCVGSGCECASGYLPVSCEGIACLQGGGCPAATSKCVDTETAACGGSVFVCDSGVLCPNHSSCAPAVGCDCETGYAAIASDGTPCGLDNGGCRGFTWGCAPRGNCGSCGILNNSVQCHGPDGGGLYYCPAYSACSGASRRCQSGYEARDCAGTPCADAGGQCIGDDWWCTYAPLGACGPIDFTVPCGTGRCPSSAACESGTCVCPSGYPTTCTNSGRCILAAADAGASSWTCVPEEGGYCPLEQWICAD